MPGGPTSSTPLGMRPPSAWYFSGVLRKSTTSRSSATASSMPATSWKVTSRSFWAYSLALLRPKVSGEPPPIIQRSSSTRPSASEATNSNRQEAGADGLEGGFFLAALKVGSHGGFEQIVQARVIFKTDARRAEGDGLRMFTAGVGAGGQVGSDDLAANVAAIDLDLLQPDALAVAAGVERLG